MKLNKHTIYISLFAVLYLIVAFSSFWHAVAFFGLANTSWMSIILAFAFEVGQAAVLFSLLTSKQDRGRVMPWVLMSMFTLVQVIGNVYSSYKYIINNSIDNLRYFKEPIFIWTDLPNDQANVIIVYLVGALLPIAALLLTSMITNYLTDIEEAKKEPLIDQENKEKIEKVIEDAPESKWLNEGDSLMNQNSILEMEKQGLQESLENKDKELDSLKEKLAQTEEDHDKMVDEKFAAEKKFNDLLEDYSEQNDEISKLKKELEELKHPQIKQIPSLEIHEPISFSESEGLKKLKEENDNTGEIRETNLEEDGQSNEEGIERDEREGDGEPELLEKIDEQEETIPEDEDPVVDENLKVADALMGGNILNKQKIQKDSHFINKP